MTNADETASMEPGGNAAGDRGWLRRILQEPLFQFVLIGLAVFALFGLRNEPGPSAPDVSEIVITQSTLERLAEQFEAVWRRPPSESEAAALLEDYVTEEILYREALALGLERDDTVIRRRLRQKMEFLTDTAAALAPPTDAELRAHYEDRLDAFTPPATLTFEQVFLGETPAEGEAEALLEALNAGADAETAGRPTLLPKTVDRSTLQSVDGTFGTGFFESVAGGPVGAWAGPVRSGFGQHLVRVAAFEPAEPAAFEAVRARVEADFLAERARTMRAQQIAALRERYVVVLPEEPST